ncbi:hypothetical protein MWU38_04375 [Qipengyuania sp. S6317L1]|uniref:hypothetical protein n=1 Tax=Qipengyuania sp. S6317L1 TaxID=2926410 RepID=UPI001FF483CA|nr:hypothetical protein [Qipengyuania sp. S6317L1]MCK0098606.1 hypothetical protein [Qipengyuania sp. S6317L1]
MAFSFDPDALLAALPRREVRPFPSDVSFRSTGRRAVPGGSVLNQDGSYNGFTHRERYRIADLSSWLAKVGSTERPTTCDICKAPADDEHAEDYYDLTKWIGMCRRCHRSALHGRFKRQANWFSLLDEYEVADGHWARLVSLEPFDMATLLRARGSCEPIKADYAPKL